MKRVITPKQASVIGYYIDTKGKGIGMKKMLKDMPADIKKMLSSLKNKGF
jgi:hypothetical protein